MKEIVPISPQQNNGLPMASLFGRYAIYVVLVIALYWVPILLFIGHPLSGQFIQSVMLLVAAAILPLNRRVSSRLRWWAWLPLGVALTLAVLVGHVYIAYEVLGHTKVPFDPVWGTVMVVYVIGGAWALEWFLLDRANRRTTSS